MAPPDPAKLLSVAPLPLDLAGLTERLIDCMPATLRRLVSAWDRRLVVLPDPGRTPPTARLLLREGDTSTEAGALALESNDPLPASTVQAKQERRRRTVLTLPASEVLTRRVSLPAQVRDNLAQVVRFELDRLSPFSPDQVLFDYRAHPPPKGAARMDVDLALCRRDKTVDWLGRLRDAGAPVDQIDWEGAWPRANLLPPDQRPRRKESWLDPAKWLTVLALLLAAAALATPLWQKARYLDTLEAEVRRARSAAIEVDDLRKELERARAGSTVVLQQKWEQPRMTALLLELTERIPDDTWVQSLEYREREVQLRGESSRATALIGLLEGAPGIEGVSFRSPVTQVARTGKERFNLAFTFRPEPAE